MGARALAWVLGAKGCGLVHVDVGNNGISASGLIDISKALALNHSLKSLSLWGNNIGGGSGGRAQGDAKALLTAMERNTLDWITYILSVQKIQ